MVDLQLGHLEKEMTKILKTKKEKHCNICGRCPSEIKEGRLVRDHNHTTGFIRGPLCDRCNINLGIYESQKHTASKILEARAKSSYINWVNEYKERIDWHLTQNTGIQYSYPFR